jgi:hypothetical protein
MTFVKMPNQFTKWLGKLMIVATLLAMIAYPSYRVLRYGTGNEQLQRHQAFLGKTSMFYNPWQYRPLAPLVNEAVYQVAAPTVLKISIFDRIYSHYDEIAGRNRILFDYTLVFVLMRSLQIAAIFYLCHLYYRRLNLSPPAIGLGLLYLTFSFGNAVYNSDFSFNTYYDVIFYLVGALLVTSRASAYWMIPLAAVAAFNRETAALLPALLLWRAVDWADFWPRLKANGGRFWQLVRWGVVPPMGLALVVFVAVTLAIRWYYGPPPAHLTGPSFATTVFQPGAKMLARNLLLPESNAEVWGVLAFLPLLCLYYFNRTSLFLRFLFGLIFTAWLPVHYWQVMVQEARLFLVPLALFLLPMSLQILEQLLRPAPPALAGQTPESQP